MLASLPAADQMIAVSILDCLLLAHFLRVDLEDMVSLPVFQLFAHILEADLADLVPMPDFLLLDHSL